MKWNGRQPAPNKAGFCTTMVTSLFCNRRWLHPKPTLLTIGQGQEVVDGAIGGKTEGQGQRDAAYKS